MLPHPQDTIVALSTPAGPGSRAVVRLSGPDALAVACSTFQRPDQAEVTEPPRGKFLSGELRLEDIAAPLPADLYFWKAPRSYTGQNLVEFHTISSPPLVELLVAQLLKAGARAAQPGEFTLRAFLAGKLDLTRAEAVLGVIEAGSQGELKQALVQLAGGVTRPLQELRDDLLNLLADVEAALDFADEDLQFVKEDELLKRLGKGLALVTLLRRQLDQRAVAGQPFRVVLAGRPNAGKSSLFNALAAAKAALVSPHPGTTRDYLVRRLAWEEVTVELVDTAGFQEGNGTITRQAQELGGQQIAGANLILLCVEAGQTISDHEKTLGQKHNLPVLAIATKCDLAEPAEGLLATSAVTGAGLGELRRTLIERARGHAQPALAPSLSRCRHHVEACLEHLRRGHAVVIHEQPAEILALEIRGALDEMGAMVGTIYTNDLLDRIFSRFCIGK